MYNLPIKFLSPWIDKAECWLLIVNTTTNEIFEYHIKADAEEPLSEDSIKIDTIAKKETEIFIKLKNPY